MEIEAVPNPGHRTDRIARRPIAPRFPFEDSDDPHEGMDSETTPEPAAALRPVSQLELRRAVMRVLIRAGHPVRVRDVIDHLERIDRVCLGDAWVSTASQRVASILRWQATHGRVRRTGWGMYEYVPGSLAATSRWRIMNWERMDRDARRRRD